VGDRLLKKMERNLPFISIKVWRILLNSGLLVVNTLGGSLFGYIFWIIASRLYSPAELGIGAALISAVAILSNLGDLGLGISYIRFGPMTRDRGDSFLNTTILAVLCSTLCFTLLFLVFVPIFMPELNMNNNPSWIELAFIGVTLSFSTAQLLDKFFIAFESNQYSLVRILIANLIRISGLIALSPSNGAINLVIAVGSGACITSLAVIKFYVPRFVPGYRFRISMNLSLIWDKVRYSLSNFLSQFLWSAPPLLYPITILIILGKEANAHFYINWMIANVLFIIPYAVSTSAFASASIPGGVSDQLFRRILFFTLAGLIPLVIAFSSLSDFLQGVFGDTYVNESQLLFYLLLSVFPYSFNTFVLVKFRILQNNRGVILFSLTIASLSLILTSVFSANLGLDGAGIGWLVGQSIGAVISIILYRKFWFLSNQPGTSKIAILQ
jgi:O-antigen/teichoic acid export membrane protein